MSVTCHGGLSDALLAFKSVLFQSLSLNSALRSCLFKHALSFDAQVPNLEASGNLCLSIKCVDFDPRSSPRLTKKES